MDCIVMLPTDFCHACETRESNLTLYLVFCTGRFCPLFWCLHSEPPFEGPSMDGEADFLSPPSQRCSSYFLPTRRWHKFE